MINGTLSKYATHENSAYPGLWRGCVGAWCPSLGPTGSRLFDYSRRQNWGTIQNATFADFWNVYSGQYANNYDGVNDVINCGSAQIFDGGVISFSFWMRSTSASIIVQIAKSRSFADNARWTFAINNSSAGSIDFLTLSTSGNSGGLGVAGAYNNGNWHHIGMTWSGLAIEMFANGKSIGTGTAGHASVNTTFDLLFGGYNDIPGGSATVNNPWAGQLDDIRIYNRQLSMAEFRILATRRGIAFTPRTRRLATIEQAAGGATPWLYARRMSRIFGGGVS